MQDIQILIPAEDSSLLMTVGTGGETIIWQARRVHDRTALMHGLAIYKPAKKFSPTKAAVSADGKKAVIVRTDSVIVLALQKKRLIEEDIILPQFPVSTDILSLNFDNSNAGALFLVAIDSSSAIFVWRIEDTAAELVCWSKLAAPAIRVVVTPQTASSAARVAFTDSEDNIRLGSLILEHDKASYRDLNSFPSQVSDLSLLACSTTNFIACVGTSAGIPQLRIINTQSSLFTTGLEYSMSLQ